jgi:hypothetical protein
MGKRQWILIPYSIKIVYSEVWKITNSTGVEKYTKDFQAGIIFEKIF